MLYSSDLASAFRNVPLTPLQTEAHGRQQGEAGYAMDVFHSLAVKASLAVMASICLLPLEVAVPLQATKLRMFGLNIRRRAHLLSFCCFHTRLFQSLAGLISTCSAIGASAMDPRDSQQRQGHSTRSEFSYFYV